MFIRSKTFVGTSANAVRIQIWTALVAMLLLKLLQFRGRIDRSLANLVALLCCRKLMNNFPPRPN